MSDAETVGIDLNSTKKTEGFSQTRYLDFEVCGQSRGGSALASLASVIKSSAYGNGLVLGRVIKMSST